MKSTYFMAITMTILSLNGCQSGVKKETKTSSHELSNHEVEHKEHGTNAHWTYEGEEGPEKWSNLCPAYAGCNGKRQSPIDLSTNISTKETALIQKHYHCVEGMEFINNGHSIQVNFIGDSANYITVDHKNFELKQFHFHCPSEHTLNHEAFDGEAHFVNVSEDGHFTVLGVFIKEGKESTFIANLLKHLPENEGDQTVVDERICPGNTFKSNDEYYIYEGSLTTPPCTEGVNWFVRKDYIEASAEQLKELARVMPVQNARPVQATNHRDFGKLDAE